MTRWVNTYLSPRNTIMFAEELQIKISQNKSVDFREGSRPRVIGKVWVGPVNRLTQIEFITENKINPADSELSFSVSTTVNYFEV